MILFLEFNPQIEFSNQSLHLRVEKMLKIVFLTLIVSVSFCQIIPSKAVSDNLSQNIRQTAQQLYVQLLNIGKDPSSLAQIYNFLKTIQADIQHINQHFQDYCTQNAIKISQDDRLIIANRQLAGLNNLTSQINLGFLISTSLRGQGLYGYMLLGVYRINLASIAQISTNPDRVFTKMNESDVIEAVKAIYMNTPAKFIISC